MDVFYEFLLVGLFSETGATRVILLKSSCYHGFAKRIKMFTCCEFAIER